MTTSGKYTVCDMTHVKSPLSSVTLSVPPEFAVKENEGRTKITRKRVD